MLAQKAAIRCEEQYGTVERPAVAFDDAHNEIDAVASRRTGEFVNCGTGDVHAAFPISTKVLATFLRTRTDYGAEIETSRISGDKRFGEQRQPCALAGRFACKRVNFLERPLTIERDRSGLHNGDFDLPRGCRWFFLFGSCTQHGSNDTAPALRFKQYIRKNSAV